MLWMNLEGLLSSIRVFVPALSRTRHKGQAGKIAVVGGCREYTGAPFFAAISALKLGADLSHVFCTREAAPVIKGYSPELIVHPVLRESYDVQFQTEPDRAALVDRVVNDVKQWLPRFDCLVIGPGLGRDGLILDCVAQIMSSARATNIAMVIDGDGLWLVNQRPDLVAGYPLAILTPNVMEHKRLVAAVVGKEYDNATPCDAAARLRDLATMLGHVTIVQKSAVDHISDGQTVLDCGEFGSPRRCGGQGDVLAGSIAVFMAWANDFKHQEGDASTSQAVFTRLSDNPAVMAGFAGSLIVRHAAHAAFAQHKRSMTTSDIIAHLGISMEALFPVGPEAEAKTS